MDTVFFLSLTVHRECFWSGSRGVACARLRNSTKIDLLRFLFTEAHPSPAQDFGTGPEAVRTIQAERSVLRSRLFAFDGYVVEPRLGWCSAWADEAHPAQFGAPLFWVLRYFRWVNRAGYFWDVKKPRRKLPRGDGRCASLWLTGLLKETPQKNRILKGCQRAVRLCDNAPSACWHPVGMHADLLWIPAVSLRSTAGFHASGMTQEGRGRGRTVKRRRSDGMRRGHVYCRQVRRVGTSCERRRPESLGGDGLTRCRTMPGIRRKSSPIH